MRRFDGIEDVAAAEGDHLGHSGWMEITQDRVDAFAGATGDHQWIHVDVERARTGPFGGTIAHGYLTLSLVPQLVAEVLEIAGLSAKLNYGSDKVRFPAPVRVGRRLRGSVEIVSVTTAEDTSTARLVLRTTVEIEGEAKPACVAETITVLVP